MKIYLWRIYWWEEAVHLVIVVAKDVDEARQIACKQMGPPFERQIMESNPADYANVPVLEYDL